MKNSKGFAHLGLVLGLVTVIILALVGLKVWQNREDSSNKNNTASATQTVTKKTETKSESKVTKDDKLVIKPRYNEWPVGLEEGIVNTYQSKTYGLTKAGCVENGKLVESVDKNYLVSSLYDKKFAEASLVDNCKNPFGASAAILALKDGRWQTVAVTQDIIDCATLNKFDVPRGFIGTCLSGDKVIANPNI